MSIENKICDCCGQPIPPGEGIYVPRLQMLFLSFAHWEKWEAENSYEDDEGEEWKNTD